MWCFVGVVSTVVGAYGHVDGIGSSARFNFPIGVSIDTMGNFIVADYLNQLIRKVTPAGNSILETNQETNNNCQISSYYIMYF